MINLVTDEAIVVIMRQVVKAFTFGLYSSHNGELLESFRQGKYIIKYIF